MRSERWRFTILVRCNHDPAFECAAVCFIPLIPCVAAIANGAHNAAFLYEPDVQRRVVALGLITPERLCRSKKWLS